MMNPEYISVMHMTEAVIDVIARAGFLVVIGYLWGAYSMAKEYKSKLEKE